MAMPYPHIGMLIKVKGQPDLPGLSYRITRVRERGPMAAFFDAESIPPAVTLSASWTLAASAFERIEVKP